jgi:hypothetical protein
MAIEARNSKKATVEDGITSETLQRAYKQFLNLIYTLYNQCLRQGCFPKIWKSFNVIPITKPGKEDNECIKIQIVKLNKTFERRFWKKFN